MDVHPSLPTQRRLVPRSYIDHPIPEACISANFITFGSLSIRLENHQHLLRSYVTSRRWRHENRSMQLCRATGKAVARVTTRRTTKCTLEAQKRVDRIRVRLGARGAIYDHHFTRCYLRTVGFQITGIGLRCSRLRDICPTFHRRTCFGCSKIRHQVWTAGLVPDCQCRCLKLVRSWPHMN